MLQTLAVENYRSLRSIVVPLGRLNVIKGVNGTGKSNLYKALRLLAETAAGGIVRSLASEGGLKSTFWAGPEKISRHMRTGRVPIQGTVRKDPVRLKLGFSSEDFGYCITMGVPVPPRLSKSAFSLDPEIKRECVWSGPACKPERILVDRSGPAVRARTEKGWQTIADGLGLFESILFQIADPNNVPEILLMRERIRSWRFYDQLRTDAEAPCRIPKLGTRTPVLSHDGADLAAAIQTILEIGDAEAVADSINAAFPGASVRIDPQADGRFAVEFLQPGLLRPLTGAELSDGTMRYLLWLAALLTPRPPLMMVLNEPETSLHPDLLPGLAGLIHKAAENTQVWVVTHSRVLVSALTQGSDTRVIELEKELGQTQVKGQGLLDRRNGDGWNEKRTLSSPRSRRKIAWAHHSAGYRRGVHHMWPFSRRKADGISTRSISVAAALNELASACVSVRTGISEDDLLRSLCGTMESPVDRAQLLCISGLKLSGAISSDYQMTFGILTPSAFMIRVTTRAL